MDITHKFHAEINLHDANFQTSEGTYLDAEVSYAAGTLIVEKEGSLMSCTNTLNQLIASIHAHDGKGNAYANTVAMLIDAARWLDRATYALNVGDGKEEADTIRKEYKVKGPASDSYIAIVSTRLPSYDFGNESFGSSVSAWLDAEDVPPETANGCVWTDSEYARYTTVIGMDKFREIGVWQRIMVKRVNEIADAMKLKVEQWLWIPITKNIYGSSEPAFWLPLPDVNAHPNAENALWKGTSYMGDNPCPEDMREISVRVLGVIANDKDSQQLSVTTKNLADEGISTLGVLIECDKEDMLDVYEMGKIRLEKIKKYLAYFGLSLRGT